MEQTVRVVSTHPDGTAQVLHVRQSACSGDCHKCSGCGAVQQKMLLTAENPIKAKPGQLVTIRTRSGPVLAAAAVLYLLPLGFFFLGYLVLQRVLGGCLGFLAGILVAVLYDRKVMRKKKTVYTITGFDQIYTSPEEGDNDLD